MAQQLAEARDNVALKENNDTFIATFVGDVRHSPANIVKDFGCVSLSKYFGKSWDSARNLIEIRRRLALAKIGDSPDRVSYK